MTDTRRAIAGFILAPLIVAIVIACIIFLISIASQPASLNGAVASALLALVYAGVVGFISAIVLGVPAYLLLKRLRIVSPWPTIATAALIGALFPRLSHWYRLDSSSSISINGCEIVAHGVTTACGYRHLALEMILPAFVGATAGLVFWLIYAGGWRLRASQKQNR